MMILIRRLWSLVCIFKSRACSAFILFSTVLYFSFRWNLFCSDLQAWTQASKMCKQYEQDKTVDSLCAQICNDQSTKSFKCHTFSSTKEAIFSVNLDDTRTVFKGVSTDIKSLHWFENGVIKYPSEKQFRSIIQAVVKKKLNITLSQSGLYSLIHLKSPDVVRSILQRQKEMDNIWKLVQDNEYLLLLIYSDKNIFPQILGTCGSYFTTEYLKPFQEVSLLNVGDDKGNWDSRLKMAIQILEFLEEFENIFPEPYYLCDIKLQDLATDKLSNKLKVVNVDGIFPLSVLRTIVSSIDNCEKDEDCSVFDCKSRCIKPGNKCEANLLNSNLQIVCEKFFLGWRLSNTFIIPGLLMSEYTPNELAAVLRQCANLHHDNQNIRRVIEEDFRERILNIVNAIEQNMDDDLFK